MVHDLDGGREFQCSMWPTGLGRHAHASAKFSEPLIKTLHLAAIRIRSSQALCFWRSQGGPTRRWPRQPACRDTKTTPSWTLQAGIIVTALRYCRGYCLVPSSSAVAPTIRGPEARSRMPRCGIEAECPSKPWLAHACLRGMDSQGHLGVLRRLARLARSDKQNGTAPADRHLVVLARRRRAGHGGGRTTQAVDRTGQTLAHLAAKSHVFEDAGHVRRTTHATGAVRLADPVRDVCHGIRRPTPIGCTPASQPASQSRPA